MAGEVPWPDLSLESRRGLPPAAADDVRRRNAAHLAAWRKELTPEQLQAWTAAVGRPAEGSRRFGSAPLPNADNSYDWRAAAQLAGLNALDRQRIESAKVVLEDVSLEQAFEAYTVPTGSVFITSDSLLNAFHVLFADSFRELELQRAQRLRPQLERLLRGARELIESRHNAYPREALQPGLRHAQLVLGPALRLLGSGPELFDEELRDEIERQVQLIRNARGTELPSWLAPASRSLLALDYRRMQPTSIYAGPPSLQDYFRAVRWLQNLPFRADRDDELTAMGLLASAFTKEKQPDGLASYDQLLGRPDHPSLAQAAHAFQNFLRGGRNSTWPSRLAQVRGELVDAAWQPRLNDALRLPPDTRDPLAEIQFRVLAPYRLPESLALARLAEPGRLPPALAVAALLGSDFALQQLANLPTDRLQDALAEARADWRGDGSKIVRRSVHDDYLAVLAALALPPDPDAPALFASDAWAAKTCQTILAGWAQMRHTFTLQAKESVYYFGLHDVPPGFVEPNPEFFHRLANLVDRCVAVLEAGGAFTRSPTTQLEELRMAADFVEGLGWHRPGASPEDLQRLTGAETIHYRAALRLVSDYDVDKTSAEAFRAGHQQVLDELRRSIAEVESRAGDHPLDAEDSRLRTQWRTLAACTRRLEAMAHKQLRGHDWSESERRFLYQYGEHLGFIMGYEGNSWLKPHDDAPRWTTVATDAFTGRLLAVGVGRPRLIRVLYPWKGTEIFTTGAVMSYYEYADTERRTDDAWKALLDSPEAPRSPAWLEPYLLR